MSDLPVDPIASFRLDGKVALVTGASSGLGVRFAEVLHAVGATVAISARRVDRLADLAERLPGSVVIPADVAEAADRERLVAEVVERCGTVDVLVNNAGVGQKVAVEDEDLELFRRGIEINLTAVWHLSKLAGAVMVPKRSGSIINVASMLGHVASAPVKQAHYTASKAGVVNLSRELAVQWGRKGVRVNSLCPGWFPSEMTAGMESDEGSQRFFANNLPMGRMGYGHELDGALLLLASDAGSYITGASIIVDGGWTAR